MKEKIRGFTLDHLQKAEIINGNFKLKYGTPERELELEEAMIYGKIISGPRILCLYF